MLDYLLKGGYTTKLLAVKTREIEIAGVCERTIYNRLNMLRREGYTAHGMMDGHSKVFYITQKGINILKELSGEE